MAKQAKLKYTKPPICPIFGRVLALAFALGLAAFSAACIYCTGVTWLIDQGSIPLISCPGSFMNADAAKEGNYCQVTFSYRTATYDSLQTSPMMTSSCIQSVSGSNDIICDVKEPCWELCTDVNGETCPDPSTLQNQNVVGVTPEECIINPMDAPAFTVPCVQIDLLPYCDSNFKVTPGNEVAIRGLIVGCVIIILVWTVGEFILRSVDIGLRKEGAAGRVRQEGILPPVKLELRALVERRWAEEYEANRRNGPASMFGEGTPRTAMGGTTTRSASMAGGHTPVRSALESRNPQRRFESTAWHRRLTQWRDLRNKKSSAFKTRVFLRSLLLNVMFLGVLTGTMCVIILVSPTHVTTSRSIFDTLLGDVSIWKIHSWLDLFIFIDVLLDVVMFLIACCVVHWPRAPVFAKHLHSEIEKFGRDELEAMENGATSGNRQLTSTASRRDKSSSGVIHEREDTDGTGSISLSMSGDGGEGGENGLDDDYEGASLESVLRQSMATDTCLMVACHESTLTEDKCRAFSDTLRAALMVFPPSHIFVCDNGNAPTPVDDSQAVARLVHPDINYIYIPEGNKTFAFYWTNRYWIPFLAQCGRVPDFKYALMTDDDVPLPPDLHIPHEYLRLHPEIKAVHFPITAATPDGNPNLLVRCQDIEYKMAAVHKYFQSCMSRSLSCHGAIGLWERAMLDRVFYDHDTVFHGEDLYMGLALLRLRDDSRIISCPQSIVPTYAPSTWPVLFRQRVKSWELTSHKKTFTYLLEFVSPASFCHAPSLVLKPYFLQELLTIMLDWLRMFLLAGLLLRDWLGLVLMTAVFTAILYFQVIVLQFIYLRQRKDLRSGVSAVITFPFYRLGGLIFRLCALCQNILVYSHDRKAVKIGVREDEVRDIPPCPPHPDVDWFTVWIDTQPAAADSPVPVPSKRPSTMSPGRANSSSLRQ